MSRRTVPGVEVVISGRLFGNIENTEPVGWTSGFDGVRCEGNDSKYLV